MPRQARKESGHFARICLCRNGGELRTKIKVAVTLGTVKALKPLRE